MQDYNKYIKQFKHFLEATNVEGEHTINHAACGACKKAVAMLRLIGGEDMETLLVHIGLVEEEDTFDQVLEKVRAGIKKQTNQAVA